MDSRKELLGLELKLKNYKEDRDSMEKEIKQINSDIQGINSQMGVMDVPPHMKIKRKNLIDKKKKIEKDLGVVRENISKNEKEIKKIKDKRYPVKHPNMPYIESILEIGSGDEEIQKSDFEDEKNDEKNSESDENINSFVPHPNVNLKRDQKSTRNSTANFVPHPNVRLSRSKEFRDWESEKINLKKKEIEKEIVSLPITKQEIGSKIIKCTCNHEIDAEILAKCSSFDNCSICRKAKKNSLKKSSKISFNNEIIENKSSGHKKVNSSFFGCKSFSDCQKCRELFKDAPHLPICNSHTKCKDCENYKNKIRRNRIENESSMEVVSVKSASSLASCMSLEQCRDCQIAREIKRAKKKKNVSHKNCMDNFCIPYFIKYCEFPCNDRRPSTQPSLSKYSNHSTSKHHKNSNSFPFRVEHLPSHECSSCHSFNKKLPRPQSHHEVYNAVLDTSHKMTQSSNFSKLSSMSNLSKTIAYCQNCSTISSVLKIPSGLMEECSKTAKSCRSIGTCEKCHQLALIARRAKMMSNDDVKSDKKPSRVSISSTEDVNWKKSSTQQSCKSLCDKCQLEEFICEGCESCENCKFCNYFKKPCDVKKKTKNSSSSGDKKTSYERMKEIIENQNEVISRIQNQIHYSAKTNASEYELEKLANNLEDAKAKLRRLVQLVIVEQRRRKDEDWKPIKVSLIDDL